jgi:ketosteroid isomerase-like protein
VGEGEHPNCELIRRLYAARARDDREAVRAILADDVRWHDPYPPPHGGDLVGAASVIEGVIERAGELTEGSTRLELRDVIASETHALALVDWSATLRGERMTGTEGAVYRIAGRRVVEAWFFPEDPAASNVFFEGGIDG